MSSDINNIPNDKAEDFSKNLQNYRQLMCYMGADIPIEALCLPKVIENSLLKDGCLRVYDLISRDLTKIKGIGRDRRNILASRLDEFFTVSI